MTTNASTLSGGLPGAGSRRITLAAALWHWLLVGRRDLLQVRSNPQLLIFVLVQPVLFVLLFVYVFGGAIAGSSRQYVQYVIPGIIVQTVVFGTAMTGIGLNEDLAKGIIDRFRSLPIARPGRVRADHRLRHGPVLGGRPDRAVGPQPRDGPVGRVHLDVPAHLRQLGVRPTPDDARLAAALRRGQPDHRGHRRPPRPAARRPGALAGAADPGLDRRPHRGVRASGHPPVPPAVLTGPRHQRRRS